MSSAEDLQHRGVAVRGRHVRTVGRVGDAGLRRGNARHHADAACLRRPAHLLPPADQGGGGPRLRPVDPAQRQPRRRGRERHRVRRRREEVGCPRPGQGGKEHYFKFGVYKQHDPSHRMESHWRNVAIYTKP